MGHWGCALGKQILHDLLGTHERAATEDLTSGPSLCPLAYHTILCLYVLTICVLLFAKAKGSLARAKTCAMSFGF